VLLVSLDEAAIKWIVLFELVVSGGGVVTEHTGDSQVLRAGVEDNLGCLTYWRAHVDCSEVHSIVSADEWDLELEVVPVVEALVG